MSSLRRIRRRSCQKKVPHATVADARRAAAMVSRVSVAALGIYSCSFCGKYHVGHPVKTAVPKRTRFQPNRR